MPRDSETCQFNSTLNPSQSHQAVNGQTYAFDSHSNRTDPWEFDFGPAAVIGASCPSANGGFNRHTTSAYQGAYDSVSTSSPFSSLHLVNLPTDVIVNNAGGTRIAETDSTYDQNTSTRLTSYSNIVGHWSTQPTQSYTGSYSTRGNATTVVHYLNTTGTFLNTENTYDIAGNVLATTDPKSYTTTFSYTDPANTYAKPTMIINPLSLKVRAAYDYSTSKPITVTDPNNAVTSLAYSDPLDRLTLVDRLPSTTAETRESFAYPSPTEVDRRQDQSTVGDGALKGMSLFDGLGRTSESRTYESSKGYISKTTSYDALGRVSQTTNPSRPGNGLNYATVLSYDVLNRASRHAQLHRIECRRAASPVAQEACAVAGSKPRRLNSCAKILKPCA